MGADKCCWHLIFIFKFLLHLLFRLFLDPALRLFVLHLLQSQTNDSKFCMNSKGHYSLEKPGFKSADEHTAAEKNSGCSQWSAKVDEHLIHVCFGGLGRIRACAVGEGGVCGVGLAREARVNVAMLIASIELILVAVITHLYIHLARLVFSVHCVSIAANDVFDQVSLVDEVHRRGIAVCPLLQIEEASLDDRGFNE
jgi:hypothetical protein